MTIEYEGLTAGKILHILFRDSSDTVCDLVAGTSGKVTFYTAEDAALETAGLTTEGTYAPVVLVGTAEAHTASDTVDGSIDAFYWDGSLVVEQNTTAALITTACETAITNKAAAITTDCETAITNKQTDFTLPSTGAAGETTPVAATVASACETAIDTKSTAFVIPLTDASGHVTVAAGTIATAVETAIDTKQASFDLPATDSSGWVTLTGGGGGGGTTVTADDIVDSRTFHAGREGNTSWNIITVNTWTTGTITLAVDFSHILNEDTGIFTVDSATVTNDADQTTTTTSSLARQKTFRAANFDVAAITAASSHTCKITITTIDSQTLSLTGTLKVE